jgi:SAM-dependent methyltransferase
MDRATWLAQRRAATVAIYDAEAPTYDENPYPRTSHERFVALLLETCPPEGMVLDAPCGTGRYFGQVAASGRRVIGLDQSSGMLERARARGIAIELRQLGLQELGFDREFDGSMTIDAMENVPPEDWPRVLANLHRAVRPGGHLYLTVEEAAEAEVEAAFRALQGRGEPAVRGEVVEGDVAGYHYYPGRDRVLGWLEAERLDLVEEAFDDEGDWGYRHLLLRERS